MRVLFFTFLLARLFGTLPYNLEKELDPFVLEMKQIRVSLNKNIFNAAIHQCEDRLLFTFRYYDEKHHQSNHFGYVWLDEELNPTGPAKRLDIAKLSKFSDKKQDLRVIRVGDRLWGLYSGYYLFNGTGKRRFTMVPLYVEGDRLSTGSPKLILNCPPLKLTRTEKNWVPFEYEGRLLLAYSINPHVIMEPYPESSEAEIVDSTEQPFRWEYGVLRGGTPAIKLDKDRYLSIFHSSISMESKQSGGEEITHYFMGAYTFESEPPFKILQMSQKPIIAKGFYTGPHYKTWKKLRCVFPCGLVDEGKTLLISYGRDDNEAWIIRVDKQGLLNSLK
ncbi:MAG: hypothetical protein KDK62_03510 [Chlamydiia bacterium]|nr:hypothetical protein [Chlamydiia bacterium]